jgi:hypothetical protein
MVLQSMEKHEKEECLIQKPPLPSTLDKTVHTCNKMDLCETNAEI